jgi:hypothetical protein
LAPKYPHGNKILAAAEPRDTDLSGFLDTGVVYLNPRDFPLIPPNTPVFVTPKRVMTRGKGPEVWKPVYEVDGRDLPDWRVKLTKGRVVLPNFNAGAVGFVERGNAAGQQLQDLWFDTSIAIDGNPEIIGKRPWLDQIALPIAAASMGERVEVPSDLHNFFPYRLKGVEDLPHINFLHYRMPLHYRKYETCRQITENLLERCPIQMRSRIRHQMGTFLKNVALSEHLTV